MIDTLKQLCTFPAVSSDEGLLGNFIIDWARNAGAVTETDPLGNVLAFKKGKRPSEKSIMLCAHMDEVGLMVTYIHESGYLSFDCVGGIDPRVIIGKRVLIGKSSIPGVIGMVPPHLTSDKEKSAIPEIGNMLIDIGAKTEAEAEKMVSLGDTACFDSKPLDLSGGMLKARAIDDRIGCAVMLSLLEYELPVDCYFAFTVQEEVGCRGAFAAAFSIKPDTALILEGTTAADLPGIEGNRRICSSGGGVVIPFMDRGTVYDRDLFQKLTDLAEKNAIPWQTKRYIAGGTDGQAVQRSRAGVKTAALAIAVRNIHSPSCIANTRDMKSMMDLTKLFLEDIV